MEVDSTGVHMAILLDAVKITRALLNDDDGLTWADHLVIPKVSLAWRELLAKFQLNGIPVVKEESTATLVSALATSITNPTDMQTPIKLSEYGVNETIDNAIPMTQVEFIPTRQQETTLRYWSWQQQQILLLGATVNRNVLIYYIKKLDPPTHLNDKLSIDQAELFIGPRTAAIIAASTGDTARAQGCDNMAAANLSLVIRAQVKNQQNLPVRRRPFSYAVRRRQRFYI
jgi:hypothetical protein